MTDRRQFLKASMLAAATTATGDALAGTLSAGRAAPAVCMASTLDFDIAASDAAWAIRHGFSYAVCDAKEPRARISAKSLYGA